MESSSLIRLPVEVEASSREIGAPLIETQDLDRLNVRRDGPAIRQLLLHLTILLSGALLWGLPLFGLQPAGLTLPWPLRVMGLLLLGSGLAFSFCAMHECGHRTAFATRWLNDTVAWWAGVLSFYNADFYRRYHQWHHRYTHQIGLDPELEDTPPATLASYVYELSGIPWWIGKVNGHLNGMLGRFGERPYINDQVAATICASIRLQAMVYGLLLLASLPGHNGFLFWMWILPLAVAQPLLRFVLLAEHGGCAFGSDGLTNTRTTLTLWPLRLLMWNMPYHSEHHLYPSLPFHALAEAHRLLQDKLRHLDHGYLRVHLGFLRNPSQLAHPVASPASR